MKKIYILLIIVSLFILNGCGKGRFKINPDHRNQTINEFSKGVLNDEECLKTLKYYTVYIDDFNFFDKYTGQLMLTTDEDRTTIRLFRVVAQDNDRTIFNDFYDYIKNKYEYFFRNEDFIYMKYKNTCIQIIYDNNKNTTIIGGDYRPYELYENSYKNK